MKSIGIKFGDNDFYNTFYHVLRNISDSYEYTNKFFTRPQLLNLINSLSPICYTMYQNPFTHNNHVDISGYLKIGNKELLIDEEVDKYMDEFKDGDNHSTFILVYPNSITCL